MKPSDIVKKVDEVVSYQDMITGPSRGRMGPEMGGGGGAPSYIPARPITPTYKGKPVPAQTTGPATQPSATVTPQAPVVRQPQTNLGRKEPVVEPTLPKQPQTNLGRKEPTLEPAPVATKQPFEPVGISKPGGTKVTEPAQTIAGPKFTPKANAGTKGPELVPREPVSRGFQPKDRLGRIDPTSEPATGPTRYFPEPKPSLAQRAKQVGKDVAAIPGGIKRAVTPQDKKSATASGAAHALGLGALLYGLNKDKEPEPAKPENVMTVNLVPGDQSASATSAAPSTSSSAAASAPSSKASQAAQAPTTQPSSSMKTLPAVSVTAKAEPKPTQADKSERPTAPAAQPKAEPKTEPTAPAVQQAQPSKAATIGEPTDFRDLPKDLEKHSPVRTPSTVTPVPKSERPKERPAASAEPSYSDVLDKKSKEQPVKVNKGDSEFKLPPESPAKGPAAKVVPQSPLSGEKPAERPTEKPAERPVDDLQDIINKLRKNEPQQSTAPSDSGDTSATPTPSRPKGQCYWDPQRGKMVHVKETINTNKESSIDKSDLYSIMNLAGLFEDIAESTMSLDFRDMLKLISEASIEEAKMSDIKGKKHSGKYGKEYDTDEEGDEKKKSEKPTEKKGRGRPKKDDGDEKKYDTDTVGKAFGIGKPPKKAIGKVSKKNKLKDWIEHVETNLLNEAEQISIAPASASTQVIKQGDKTLGTVNNPQLAQQIKQSIGRGEMSLAGTDLDESGLQAYLGNKKYGKDGMNALRKAGRDGVSKEKMAKIRAKYDKMDEGEAEDQAYAKAKAQNDSITRQQATDAAIYTANKGQPPSPNEGPVVQQPKKPTQRVEPRIKEEALDQPATMEQANGDGAIRMQGKMMNHPMNEKAVSKAQQKFMGMVHAAQKGKKPASKEVAKVAKSMPKKAAKDFAATKHKGLPQHVNELSPDTLSSYADKAKGQRGWAWGRAQAGKQGVGNADPEGKFDRLHQKRAAGYNQAVSKGARDLDKSGQKSSWDWSTGKSPAALTRESESPIGKDFTTSKERLAPHAGMGKGKIQQKLGQAGVVAKNIGRFMKGKKEIPTMEGYKLPDGTILTEGAMKDLVTRFIEDLTTSKARGFNINLAVETGDLAAAKRAINNTLTHGDRYKRLAHTLKSDLRDYALEEFGFTDYDGSLDECDTRPDLPDVTDVLNDEPSVFKPTGVMSPVPPTEESVAPFSAGRQEDEGSFLSSLRKSAKVTMESNNMKDLTIENWDKQLKGLLNEGLTVSSSTGQQGSPDSVTISATDADAQELLNIVRKAGLGVFGGSEGGEEMSPDHMHGMLMSVPGEEPDGHGTEPQASPDVVGDGDDMLALIKKMSGISDMPAAEHDYEDEEGEEDEEETTDDESEQGEEDQESDAGEESEEEDEGDEEKVNEEDELQTSVDDQGRIRYMRDPKNPSPQKSSVDDRGRLQYKDTDRPNSTSVDDQDRIHYMRDPKNPSPQKSSVDDKGRLQYKDTDRPQQSSVDDKGRLQYKGDGAGRQQSSVDDKGRIRFVKEYDGEMEEGNAFTGALAKAKADGVQKGETMKVGGKTYPVKEDDMEEGNAFTGKLANTPKGGEFELDGKKFKDTSNLEEMDGEICENCSMTYEACECDHESVEEAFANEAGQNGVAEAELAKLKALLSMGNDLHKMKRDQTVLNPTQVTVRESLNEWKKLSGIK